MSTCRHQNAEMYIVKFTEPCLVHLILGDPVPVQTSHVHAPLQQNGVFEKLSILQRDLYMAISWLQAYGILTKMKDDVLSTIQGDTIYNPYERVDNIAKVRSSIKKQIRGALSISHLTPPFILIVIGLFMSLLAFCVEKCRKKVVRAKKGHLNHYTWAIGTEHVIVI